MNQRTFLIECSKCNQRMKYMTKKPDHELSKAKKKCVYCGFSITVSKGIVKKDL